MGLFRMVGVSVLSVALCLLLGWGTMVLVHAGPQDAASGIEIFPAATGAPAGYHPPSGTQPPPSPASVPPGKPTSYSSSRSRTRSNPLKDVTDLGKATTAQLQGADRFLESETRRLTEQYAKAEDAEARAKLKGELAKTIEKHFDVRHQVRKREIDQLEARVKKLREHLQKREGARQAIVEMRLGQFISAAEGLGWDTDLGRTRSASGVPALPLSPSEPSSNKRGLFGPRQSANPARR